MRRQYFDHDDVTIAYLRSGAPAGPTVVFIHGMAETSESCWESQLADLGSEFNCYAIDLRGHGESTVGMADGTLDQLGGDLLAFLAHVTGPATVVGFSIGGTIALWAAAQGAELIEHVVAVGGSSVISQATATFFQDKAAAIQARKLSDLHRDIAAEVGAMFVAHPERAEAYGHRRIAAVGEGDGYANAALAMARMREFKLQPLLANVTCPTDIVGGEFDQWCPRKAGDIIVAGLTQGHARYTEIPGVGHLMSVDEPEAVSAELSRLIADRPPSANATTAGSTHD